MISTLAEQHCNTIATSYSTSMAEVLFDPEECISIKLIGELYVDYNLGWFRLDFVAHVANGGGASAKMSIWVNLKTNTSYTLNRDTGDCQNATWTFPFGSNSLPPDSKFTGSVNIGPLEVETFYIPPQENFGPYAAEVSLTSGSCTPVSSIVFNSETSQVILTESFWNFVPSVKSNIFDLPSACQKSQERSSLLARRQLNKMKIFKAKDIEEKKKLTSLPSFLQRPRRGFFL